MKRELNMLLILALGFGLAACGGGGDDGNGDAPTGGGDAVVESPVDPATAGSISGSVAFEGTPPEMAIIAMDAEEVCADKYTDPPRDQSVVVNDNGTLQNVFVYVKTGLEGMAFPVPAAVTLDQNGCQYEPHVLGLQTGQTLTVLNSDAALHNIHPVPSVNRGFNESQPTEGMSFDKTFSQAEVMIPVSCDVHDWMSAYIGVVEHPYFAVTGSDGSFSLDNLPPGTYTVAAWHEEYGELTQEVTVGASEAAEVSFSFSGQ